VSELQSEGRRRPSAPAGTAEKKTGQCSSTTADSDVGRMHWCDKKKAEKQRPWGRKKKTDLKVTGAANERYKRKKQRCNLSGRKA